MADKNGLAGRRFGKLTVTGDSGQRKGGCILWDCRCGCGGRILALRYQLESGNVTSCGCVRKPHASKRQAEDLTGQRFGELTVIRRAENDANGNVCWVCRCSCGRETTTQALQLKSGKTRSCGCMRHREAANAHDLSGRRFGRLTALYRVPGKGAPGKAVWHCRCDCGKETDVYAGSLLRGLTTSCGCRNREVSSRMHEHLHYQNDTCAEVLKHACTEDGSRNKAGFRGLYRMGNGRYRATITFQGKHYNLGHYTDYADAVRARLEAEEALHAGYLKAMERYREKAEEDPAWAESNPFYYTAERADGEFVVSTNGV